MNRSKGIHYVILILAGIAVLFFVLLFLHEQSKVLRNPIVSNSLAMSDNQIYNQALMAGGLTIPVSIADTPAAREQGLSGTTTLPANAGKLFIFDTPGNYGFWMKDMNYGLDFVWIDSAMKVIAVTPNVTADTYPQIFYPPQPVQYVLEVNAGFSSKNNLTVGQQLLLK